MDSKLLLSNNNPIESNTFIKSNTNHVEITKILSTSQCQSIIIDC